MAERATILCAGEALTDMIRAGADTWHSRVGGSTWNVARALASLGAASGFAGAISRCVFGDALWAASEQADLDLRYLQRYAKSPLLAMVPATAPPQYFFVGDDSADLYFDPAAMPAGWTGDIKWLHFGGISLARQPLAGTLLEFAAEAKRHGIRISYDPNWRNVMDEAYDATLWRMTQLADVVKVSDEDVRALFRTDDIEAALATLRSFNPHATVLFTRGADGASLYRGDEAWHAPAPRIDLVDSVGAGDASMAGLIYSLHHHPHREWPQHLAFSVAAGAAACCAAGAHAPTLAEVEELRAASTV